MRARLMHALLRNFPQFLRHEREQAPANESKHPSRFWPADQYAPGRRQPSFDKQFVRDYLETLDWNKTPPGPVLPPEVVANTQAKYLEAYERLTGQKLAPPV